MKLFAKQFLAVMVTAILCVAFVNYAPARAQTTFPANFNNITTNTLVATGIVAGSVPVTVVTGTTFTFGTYNVGFYFNENATAATGTTGTLPTAASGLQYCLSNAYNGSAANTGALEIATHASGQYIIFTDGTLSASGGNVTSGGAAADGACVVGVDSTHWMLYVQSGTWTKN